MAKQNNVELKEGYEPGSVFWGNLKEINEGELLTQLDECFQSLVAAVMNTGKKGSLSLQINIKRKGGVTQCEIVPVVKTNIPKEDTPARIMFADPQGNLYTSDPAQGQLDFNDKPMRVLPNKPVGGAVVDISTGQPAAVAR